MSGAMAWVKPSSLTASRLTAAGMDNGAALTTARAFGWATAGAGWRTGRALGRKLGVRTGLKWRLGETRGEVRLTPGRAGTPTMGAATLPLTVWAEEGRGRMRASEQRGTSFILEASMDYPTFTL